MLSSVDVHQVNVARKACEDVSLTLKVVKALLYPTPKGGTVVVSVECLHRSADDFLRYLERYLDMAHAAFKKIAESL